MMSKIMGAALKAVLAVFAFLALSACGGGDETAGSMTGTEENGGRPDVKMPLDMAPVLEVTTGAMFTKGKNVDFIELEWNVIPGAVSNDVERLGVVITNRSAIVPSIRDWDPPFGEVTYRVIPIDKRGTSGMPSNQVRVTVVPPDPCTYCSDEQICNDGVCEDPPVDDSQWAYLNRTLTCQRTGGLPGGIVHPFQNPCRVSEGIVTCDRLIPRGVDLRNPPEWFTLHPGVGFDYSDEEGAIYPCR